MHWTILSACRLSIEFLGRAVCSSPMKAAPEFAILCSWLETEARKKIVCFRGVKMAHIVPATAMIGQWSHSGQLPHNELHTLKSFATPSFRGSRIRSDSSDLLGVLWRLSCSAHRNVLCGSLCGWNWWSDIFPNSWNTGFDRMLRKSLPPFPQCGSRVFSRSVAGRNSSLPDTCHLQWREFPKEKKFRSESCLKSWTPSYKETVMSYLTKKTLV